VALRSKSINFGEDTFPSTAVPAGSAIDDITILTVTIDNGSAVIDPADWPAGFLELSEISVTTLDGQDVAIAWKRLTAADSGTYQLGDPGGVATNHWIMAAYCFSGRDTANPPTFTPTTQAAGLSSPVTANGGSLTALAGDDLLWITLTDLSAISIYTGGTVPSGYTEEHDQNNFWTAMFSGTKQNVSAGATGTQAGSFTLSSGTSGYVNYHLRIPAAQVPDVGPGEVRLTGSAGAELVTGTSTAIKLTSLLDALEPRAHFVKETPGQVFASTLTISGLAATALNHGVLLLLHQSQAITSVVDNLGAAWSVAGDQSTGVEGRVGIWYREDLPAGVTSVTITAAASTALIADVVEISGDVTFRGATVGAYGSIANPAAVTVANAPDGAIVLSVAGYFNAARGETIPADYAKLGHPGMSIASTHFLASFKELAAAENPAGPDYGARADATSYTNFGSVTAVFGP
jgi:hypothetical protein